MRYLAIASIAAFASLVVSANVAANVANSRSEGWGGLTMPQAEMARGRERKAPAPKVDTTGPYYIRAIQNVGGEKGEVRYTRTTKEGAFVMIFDGKAACEKARATDPDVVGMLASYLALVKLRGGTTVISCEKWVLPVMPDDAIHRPAPQPPGQDI